MASNLHTTSQSKDIWKDICEGVNPLLMQEMDEEDKKDNHGKLEESLKIGSYMKNLMSSYEQLRGRSPESVGVQFWDVVVISAGDVSQQSWYEAQLSLKHDSGDLPLLTYHIIPDPPGPRIGSGGSTLHILSHLKTLYGDKMDKWRILLIHAGGYSKRLPSHSCSGKIFSPLPIAAGKGGPYQMLDLKLAMYLPFLSMMEAGVFVTASDDIEVFNMDTSSIENSKMMGETVTALAHPSSLYIGTTHGVYVMTPAETRETTTELQDVRQCLEVLQKPSVDLMRERGAVQIGDDGSETVYSDSAFWFHSPTTNKLVHLYQDLGTIDAEVCIYGDFLTCLGQRKKKYYLEKLYKADNIKKDVVIKRKINEKVGDTDLSVLSLHQSKFYHLGTTQEYLHGLTNDKYLKMELNLANVVSSHITAKETSNVEGIVLSSILDKSIDVPQDAIVEYSIIQSKICLGAKTILSNVEIQDDVDIPPGFLYHTVPILVDGSRKHVTVAFHITDDMKFSADIDRAENLQFGGKLLEKLFSMWPQIYNKSSVFPQNSTASLWNARIFTAQASMSASFLATVRMISSLVSKEKFDTFENVNSKLFSMEELVNLKDCDGILEFRKQLSKKILSMTS